MSEVTSCPADHEAIERPHASWMQAAAQDILDGRDIGESLGDLKSRLEDSYALMAEHRPGKAAVNVARKVRAAYLAPVGHIYIGRMVANAETLRNQGKLESYLAHARYTNFDITTKYITPEYLGEAHAYMQTMLTLIDDSIYSLVSDRFSPSGKLYNSLVGHGDEIADMMQSAAAVWDDEFYSNFFSKHRGFYMTMGNVTIENSLISLEQMLGIQSALAESGYILEPGEIGEVVRNNIDTAVQYGGANRSVLGAQQLFAGSGRESIFQSDGNDLEPYTKLFTADPAFRRIMPRHRSLKNGPWKSPGNCPADLQLRFSDPLLAESVQSFFNAYGMDCCDDGFFRTNDGLLTIGSLVGEHTIFRPTEKTPPQLLKGMARTAIDLVA
jgi:hypothetical protein